MNPFKVILELLYFLTKSIIEALFFIFSKALDFFVALAGFSSISMQNAVIGTLVGALVLFLIVKYVFGLSKELIIILLLYFAIALILIVYRLIS
ncbi:MAG: hypothetical protein QXO84_02570 [Candidatus Aenigmatarchaeota archaeon]